QGFRDALAAANIELDESLLCPGDFTLESGYRAASVLIETRERPTAIFCENDEMAIGAIQCLKEQGLRVPDDISVAGFDDIAFARYCDPPLTTISQPAEDFGHEAVALLLGLMDGGDIQRETRRVMPFKLVVRDSTGRVQR